MTTVESLVVEMREEGMTETREQIEGVEDDFEDATDQVGEEADQMEAFANKWRGAMTAITAGLAVAAGGILSRVPVIGEAFGGLNAVIDGLAFQIDKALRPHLQGLTNELFELSEEVYSSEGPLEALDAIASKISEIGMESIELAIEDDAIGVGTDELLTFVFPKLENEDILSAVTSPDLSAAGVVSALFGFSALGASKLIGLLFGKKIGARTILKTIFTAVAAGAVLSFLFEDINMTEGTILGAILAFSAMSASKVLGFVFGSSIGWKKILKWVFIPITIGKFFDFILGESWDMSEDKLLTAIFAGLALTAAGVLVVVFGGISMTAALILGSIFAGVTITGSMVMKWLFSKIPQLTPAGQDPTGGGKMTKGQGLGPIQDPFNVSQNQGSFTQQGTQTPSGMSPMEQFLGEFGGLQLDGRELTEQTGRYENDKVTRRGGP